ncbi:MAG: glycosyltransferase family 2 protein [Micrococcales bacterium]|nr:glycosyltransferase family 2 protein [Micrococcales bacterium]
MTDPATAPAGTRVVAVLVTYHPDTAVLGRLLDRLAPQVDDVVVVDNGSHDATLAQLTELVDGRGTLVALGHNTGIAAAQNTGIDWARERGATHVLFSDDDSAPADDMVARLVIAITSADPDDRVAAVGPVTVDPRTGEAPLVFTDHGLAPRRIGHLPDTDGAVVDVAFLIASGCLVDMRALDDVGGMNANLFIDHVDLEWGVRARRAGWALQVVIGADLRHSLGDTTRTVPLRSRAVHIQSPVRNYYTVRNTVYLIRTFFDPLWRRGYTRWITRYIGYYLLAVPPRRTRLRLMARGLRDARKGRLGPLTG